MSDTTIVDRIMDSINEAEIKRAKGGRSKLEAIYIGRLEKRQLLLTMYNDTYTNPWRPELKKPLLEGYRFDGLKLYIVNDETHLRVV